MTDPPSSRMDRLLQRVLEVLGNTYDEVAYLNEGGMGAVFTGRHKRLHRTDAIKVLYVDGPAAEDALRRFQGEWQTIAALGRSPHIVSIYEADHDEERDLAWLTEEFVDGPSLKERMAGGRLPVPEALDIASQIAKGLLYAHERGVIHRDVKPGNILVDRSGDVLLTDFGLARFQGDDRLTQTHMAVGTLAFMSPEAFSGADPAPPMDVYSLGVVLFEMFTGQRLFGGANVIEQQLNEPPRDPRTLAPDLPGDLADLILAMLAKKAEERPAMKEVVERLETIRAAPLPVADATRAFDATDADIPVPPAAGARGGTSSGTSVTDASSRGARPGNRRGWMAAGAVVVAAVIVAAVWFGPLGGGGGDGVADDGAGTDLAATEVPGGGGAPLGRVPAGGSAADTLADDATDTADPLSTAPGTGTQPADDAGSDAETSSGAGGPAGNDGEDRETGNGQTDPADAGTGGSPADPPSQDPPVQRDPDPDPAPPAEITLQIGVAGEYRRQVQTFRILVDGAELGDRPGMYTVERPSDGRLTVSLRRFGFMFDPAETTVTLGNRDRVMLEFVPSPM